MRLKKSSTPGAIPWGYRQRLFASIGSLLLMAFVPLVLYGISTDRNLLRDHFDRTGDYLVKNLARNSETGVFSESVSFLQAPLAAITDKQEVLWAAVYGSDAALIRAIGLGAEKMPPLPQDIQQWMHAADSASVRRMTVSAEGAAGFDFFAPIFLVQGSFFEYDFEQDTGSSAERGEVIGFARVGISLAMLNERTNEILRTSLLLAVIYVLVSCFAVLLIQRSISKPIQKLAAGALKIGAGDLTWRINVHTRDEIEDLAESFNHMASQLQQAVDERLLNEQQRESLLSDIENKNKELESLVYVVSHDLRSPLVNIQGFSQILQQQVIDCAAAVDTIRSGMPHDPAISAAPGDDPGSEMQQSIGFILAGAAKIDALLNGLLIVSRTGRAPMNIREVDAGRLLADIIAAQQFQLSEISATVTLGELPCCHGDEHLLNQIFSNLISNVVKYRDPQRPLVIEISGREQGGMIIYLVRDNGQGIAPRHLDRIWNAFYRVDAGLPDSGEGLGLAIVKRIVEKHQGRVRVESTLGRGSVFYVELQKNMFYV